MRKFRRLADDNQLQHDLLIKQNPQRVRSVRPALRYMRTVIGIKLSLNPLLDQ